jgi:hypothetical protein
MIMQHMTCFSAPYRNGQAISGFEDMCLDLDLPALKVLRWPRQQ